MGCSVSLFEDLTVVLPTYNEGGNIQHMLATLTELYPGVSVLVADDNSRDGTQQKVGEFSATNARVRLLNRDPNDRGLTASIMEGLMNVSTPYYVVMDADFQHPPEYVRELHARLKDGADLAVGVREDKNSLGLGRKLASVGAHALAAAYLRVMRQPTSEDTMSGFFGGRTDICQRTISGMGHRFERRGFKVLFDLLKYLPRDTRVEEVAFPFSMRRSGESKLSSRVILSILRQCGLAGKAAAVAVNFLFINMFGRFLSALVLGLTFTFVFMGTLDVAYDDHFVTSTVLAFVLALAYLVVANKFMMTHGRRDKMIMGMKMVFTGFSGYLVNFYIFYMFFSDQYAVQTWPMFLGFGIAYLWNAFSSAIPEK